MTLRPPFIRAAIALLFEVQAAIAGYHAALGLAYIGILAEGWRQANGIDRSDRHGQARPGRA